MYNVGPRIAHAGSLWWSSVQISCPLLLENPHDLVVWRRHDLEEMLLDARKQLEALKLPLHHLRLYPHSSRLHLFLFRSQVFMRSYFMVLLSLSLAGPCWWFFAGRHLVLAGKA